VESVVILRSEVVKKCQELEPRKGKISLLLIKYETSELEA